MVRARKEETQGLLLPLWYLQLDFEFNKYEKRFVFFMAYIFIGLYAWVPLLSAQTQIKIEDLYGYYIVFYAIYFIIGYIILQVFFVKYKLSSTERFAYKLFRVHLSLERVILDENIQNSLKINLNSLRQEMRIIKRDLNALKDQGLIKSLNICIKNLYKLNDTKRNKPYILSISPKLKKMSEELHNSTKIDLIEKEIANLSENLKNLQKVRITDKTQYWKKNI